MTYEYEDALARREEEAAAALTADLRRRVEGFSVYPTGTPKMIFQLGARVLVGEYPGTVVSVPVGAEHGLYGVLLDVVRDKLKSMSPEGRACAPSGILSVAVEALELLERSS